MPEPIDLDALDLEQLKELRARLDRKIVEVQNEPTRIIWCLETPYAEVARFRDDQFVEAADALAKEARSLAPLVAAMKPTDDPHKYGLSLVPITVPAADYAEHFPIRIVE